jgi:hypothetical protein
MIDPDDPLDLLESSWNPLSVSRKLMLIPLVLIIVGLIIPAAIAHESGVFYMPDIKGEIAGKIKEPVKSQIRDFDEQQDQLSSHIKTARQVILSRPDKSRARSRNRSRP